MYELALIGPYHYVKLQTARQGRDETPKDVRLCRKNEKSVKLDEPLA
jgi:hypothetical protein